MFDDTHVLCTRTNSVWPAQLKITSSVGISNALQVEQDGRHLPTLLSFNWPTSSILQTTVRFTVSLLSPLMSCNLLTSHTECEQPHYHYMHLSTWIHNSSWHSGNCGVATEILVWLMSWQWSLLVAWLGASSNLIGGLCWFHILYAMLPNTLCMYAHKLLPYISIPALIIRLPLIASEAILCRLITKRVAVMYTLICAACFERTKRFHLSRDKILTRFWHVMENYGSLCFREECHKHVPLHRGWMIYYSKPNMYIARTASSPFTIATWKVKVTQM